MKRTAIAFTLLFLIVGLLAPVSEATRTKKKKSTSAGKKVAILAGAGAPAGDRRGDRDRRALGRRHRQGAARQGGGA